eukprot:4558845-Pyramimonas_sp.AAC.1
MAHAAVSDELAAVKSQLARSKVKLEEEKHRSGELDAEVSRHLYNGSEAERAKESERAASDELAKQRALVAALQEQARRCEFRLVGVNRDLWVGANSGS